MFNSENGGNGMFMPVAPAYGYGGNGFGMGGDWAWIILLLLAFGGGWGGYGMGGGMFGAEGLYPWMNNSQNINSGFRDQFLNDNITGIRSDLGDISTQLCNGFNQTQMGTLQAVNGIQSQLAQCCCDNRLATQDLKYTIATEENTTRTANSANTQAILDKLCQLELDGVKAQVEAKNDRIAELQTQLNMANLRESQTAQNAFIAQGLNQEVDALYNRLSNCPVPTTPVYGRTPIFTCNNNGTGCGCSGNF